MKNERSFKVGVGETVITPQENLLMHGFARSQVATGVHDELHSRCMIVKDASGNMAVLLSVSIVGIGRRESFDRMRNSVAELVGVPKEAIMLSSQHTHAGPHIEKAPDSHKEYLVSQITKSAELALEDLAPARIGVGTTSQLEIGRNRRRLLYGGMHPDPQLAVVKIEDISGKLKGVLFNYGCHPSTLDWRNTLYSEDWPYYAICGIKEVVGNDVWVCFLLGAQGDINTGYDSLLSAIGADMPVRDYPYIKYKGKQMSRSVLDILPDIKTDDSLTVETISEFHDLPLRKDFPVTLSEAENKLKLVEKDLREMESKPEYKGSRILDEYRTNLFSARQTFDLANVFYSGNLPPNESTEIQAIRFGSTIIFSLPGEIFSEIALAIKQQSPYKNTFGAALTNGYYAYMPTREEFINGNYEVDGSKYCPESEDALIESTLKVVNKLAGE